ncbi:MAG: transposase [Lachnospiraceae bacterium]|nr:transposase [Lachnospiraceae bacterium]
MKKYLEGNPNNLCRSNKHGTLEAFKDSIIKAVQDGMTQAAIIRQLEGMGYTGTGSNVRQYISSLAREYGLKIAKYNNTCPESGDVTARGRKAKFDYITRKDIFDHLWMEVELTPWHHDQLWQRYPVLQEIELCIRQFREIFDKGSMPLLYIFIDRYKQSVIKELATFARGLEKDLASVENAVASPLSSGFVEGINNKVKMVKRAMYGRCGIKLLAAKLMYQVV